MDEIDHKERCELLRSYFQKVNPNSIPCTYKSNFEASAIHTLLNSETNGLKDQFDISKDFGPWRMCTPNKSSEKTTIKTHNVENTKKMNKNQTNSKYRPKTNNFRSKSDGSASSVHVKRTKETNKKSDESKQNSIPIHIPYQYSDDYKQYIENYKRSYTQCKLYEANQARPTAARTGLRAYDFRCGMRPVTKQEAIGLKTITLQVPPNESHFPSSASLCPLVWSGERRR